MKEKKLFSIGELSRKCNLSISTLRHYDRVGCLKPVYVDSDTGYRYYSEDSVLEASLLTVYKSFNLSLETTKSLLERDELCSLKQMFMDLVLEMTEEISILQKKQKFFLEWCDLLDEAVDVLNGNNPDISIRYISYSGMSSYQPNIYDNTTLKQLLVYSEGLCGGHLNFTYGPLFLTFPSFDTRLKNNLHKVGYFIACNPDEPEYADTVTLGGYSAVTAYHIGSHDTIAETYEKMVDWARVHNFELRGDCVERYVTDYWSSYHAELFVTEVILPLK